MLRLASDADVYGSVARGLFLREPGLDFVRVQDVGLRTASDPDILEWAATENRVLITRDRKTCVRAAYARVAAALPMPGVIVIRKNAGVGKIIEDILIVASCSSEDELKNRVLFVPL
jgi:predicted nuclease of predicted toxin-antitoxin system